MNLSELQLRLNWYVTYKHILSLHAGSSADRRRARRGLSDIINWLSYHGVSSLFLNVVRPNLYSVSCLIRGSLYTQQVTI